MKYIYIFLKIKMTNVDSESSLIHTCTCRGIVQLSDFF